MFLRYLRAGALLSIAFSLGCAGGRKLEERTASQGAPLADYGDELAWSDMPPGLQPIDVPQFVAVTFDDNFVSGLDGPSGGMTWATDFFRALENPSGAAIAATFDGSAVRTTFFDNCVYLDDASTRDAWTTAVQDGHEIGNHTTNHPDGTSFTAQDWTDEIASCTDALADQVGGLGLNVDQVRGFRSPYLAFNENLFAALKSEGLEYDTSVQSCWAASEDGTNCAWPYTLDSGSPDATAISAKFGASMVSPAAGLWEVPPSALFVPPDELSSKYAFSPGLRQRIPTDMPAPSFYEAATGRIAPLDITLFVDAGMTADEVLATLEYTLDLHLSGNRAPFVFVAHTHVYASNYGAASSAAEVGERQRAIEDFLAYALSKPMVRMRPLADVLAWMRDPAPLNGVVTAPITDGGADAEASAADADASGGRSGSSPDAGLATAGSTSAGAAGRAGDGAAGAGSATTTSGCTCELGRASDETELLSAFALLAFASLFRGARRLWST